MIPTNDPLYAEAAAFNALYPSIQVSNALASIAAGESWWLNADGSVRDGTLSERLRLAKAGDPVSGFIGPVPPAASAAPNYFVADAPEAVPLTATILPNGQTIISHAPYIAPVTQTQAAQAPGSNIWLLIALGVGAYFLFKD